MAGADRVASASALGDIPTLVRASEIVVDQDVRVIGIARGVQRPAAWAIDDLAPFDGNGVDPAVGARVVVEAGSVERARIDPHAVAVLDQDGVWRAIADMDVGNRDVLAIAHGEEAPPALDGD